MTDFCKLPRKLFLNSILTVLEFRAVGNGGFAGGINWVDMVCLRLAQQ